MSHIHRLTEAELFASFVALSGYLERVALSAAGSVVAVNGMQLIVCDTTGGGFTVTLDDPGPDAAPDRWRPIIINVGTNTLTVDPQTAEINGQTGTQTIVTQFAAFDLVHDGTDFFAADDIKPVFAPSNVASFILDYDVADAHNAGEIWSDAGRTINAVADGAIDNFDASFVVSGAAATPRADHSGPGGVPLLRLSPSLSLPPSGLPIISMFRDGTGNEGGFDTDWHTIAPFDTFVTGINTPFSLAMVARFTDLSTLSHFFAWQGGDGKSRIHFNLSAVAGRIDVEKIDSDNNIVVANSGANLVSGAWETYVFIFNGATLDVYENGALLFSGGFTVPLALAQDGLAATAIGHGYQFPALVVNDALEFDFANLAFFDEAISAAERVALNSYYNARHGL